MAILNLIETIQTKLSTLNKKDGQLIVIRDNASLYVDLDGARIYISDWIDVSTDEERLAMISPLSNKYYYVVETNKIWRYISGSWVLVTKEYVVDSELSTTSENPVSNKVVTNAINEINDSLDSIGNTIFNGIGSAMASLGVEFTGGTTAELFAILPTFTDIMFYTTSSIITDIPSTYGLLHVMKFSASGSGNTAICYDTTGGTTWRYKYHATSTINNGWVKLLNATDELKYFKTISTLTSSNDLNNILEMGVYYYASSSIPVNAPYQNASFVEVIKYNDNRVIQRVTMAGVKGYIKERIYSGSWLEWTEYINDNNIGNYAITISSDGKINNNIGIDRGTEAGTFDSYRTVDGVQTRSRFWDAGGKASIGLFQPDGTVALAQLVVAEDGARYIVGENTYDIFHTGNKPQNTYIGNGNTTQRTINTGGIGNICIIHSSNGICLVTPHGAMSVDTSSNSKFISGVTCPAGVLTFSSNSTLLNENGVEYTYRML